MPTNQATGVHVETSFGWLALAISESHPNMVSKNIMKHHSNYCVN
jgi:hypothetical protein